MWNSCDFFEYHYAITFLRFVFIILLAIPHPHHSVSFINLKMVNRIKIDVFGRMVLATQSDKGWSIYYLSGGGKRRPANDIVIPSFVDESEIETYLADICHEWASEKYSEVRRLD